MQSFVHNIQLRKLAATARQGILVLLVLLCLCAAAYASGGGHHEPSIRDLGRYWVNFLIFLGIIYAALRKPMPAAWENRRAAISRVIEQAQSELKAARAELEDAEQRLLVADLHAQDLAKKLQAASASETGEILAEAKRKAAAIQEQARRSASAEREAAKRALREEAVDLAVTRAVELAKERLSPERDRSIREAALGGVPLLMQ